MEPAWGNAGYVTQGWQVGVRGDGKSEQSPDNWADSWITWGELEEPAFRGERLTVKMGGDLYGGGFHFQA